jgi:multidrug efflux pump subunit AcrB
MINILYFLWNHKIGVIFFLFLLSILGVFSSIKIEKTMYPNTNLPQYVVQASWGNYSPEVMEMKITAPVERSVSKLKYIKGIKSESSKGSATITLYCDKSYNEKEFELLLNESMQALRNDFSRNVQINVVRRKPEEFGEREGFIGYRIFSKYSVDSLSRVVENEVKTSLASVEGVAEVNEYGLEKQGYFIHVKKEFRNIPQFSIFNIQLKIREFFQLRPNSVAKLNEDEFVVKFDEQVINNELLKEIPIAKLDSRVLKLGEVARINKGPEIKRMLIRFNGLEGITLDIKRQADASAISTAEKVKERMADLAKKFDLKTELLTDEGKKVTQKLDDLFLRVIISLIVIFIIVFIITKQMYNSVIVMLLLVLSALFAILGLYITGNSVNLTTIAGLALGFGMIIDNSLVVVEKLSHLKQNQNFKENVITAINHIIVPVKVATFTSVGAILPVFVMDEMLKITLSPFVIALSFSLIASLIISIVFLPLLIKESKRYSEITEKQNYFIRFILWLGKKKKTSILLIAMLLGIPGVPFYFYPVPNQVTGWDTYNTVFNSNLFKNTIKPVVNYGFGGAPFVYINDLKDKFSWGAYRSAGDDEEKKMNLFIRGPSGMRLEDMNSIMTKFETKVQPFTHLIDHMFVQVFQSMATMEVIFKDEHFFDGTPERIKDALAELTINFGGLDLSISGVGDNISIRGAGRGGFSFGEGALKYKLTGPSYDELRRFAEKISTDFLEDNRRIKNIDLNGGGGFRNRSQDQIELTYDLKLRPYEYDWVNRNLLFLFQRDETELSVPGEYGEERIYIKSEQQGIETIYDFNSLILQDDSSRSIKISKLGTLTEQEIQGEIERENQLYVRYISFEYRSSKKRIEEFQKKFETSIQSILPDDMKFEENKNERIFALEEGLDKKLILLITLLIVFAIVAMYFESYKYAAAIFLIIPFSLVGIIYFFWIMDEAIDSDALFGLMFVAGIVINNAAFVLYEILRKRRENVPMNQAVEETVIDRFKPVVLTTITTVLGILPLFLPQILNQMLDPYTIAQLDHYLPESISNFLLKNTNTDPMWYAMSLSIISGTAASFFFSLWIPVVLFYKKKKDLLIS